MTKYLISLIVLIVIAAIVLPQALFTVDETQVAIVTRFGAFKTAYRTPGLKMKTPFVESVTRFDKRLLRLDAQPALLLTKDKRNLMIDAYARYRIKDPLLFYQTLTSEIVADSRVNDIVASELRREVALDEQSEIISETREQIMKRVTTAANRAAITRQQMEARPGGVQNPSLTIRITERGDEEAEEVQERPPTQEERTALISDPAPGILDGLEVAYFVPLVEKFGIEILDVRMKRVDFSTDIAESIFARMRAERLQKASKERAEGAEQDKKIRAEVDRDVRILLETAQGTSALLRGEGEQRAIEILAEALERDPDFYAFQRSLEAYTKSLASDTTVILSAESDLFRYLENPQGRTAP